MQFANSLRRSAVLWLLTMSCAGSAWSQEARSDREPIPPPPEADVPTKEEAPPAPSTTPDNQVPDAAPAAPTTAPAVQKVPPVPAAEAVAPTDAQSNTSDAGETNSEAVPTVVELPAAAPVGSDNTSMRVGAVDVFVAGKRSRTLDLPGSVDIIGEDQTSKAVTTNALDLMRRIPGFAYQDYGNGGVPNGFMLRGFSSNHGNDTLVVIDGVPINDHNWNGQDDGAPDLNQLTSEEIERIEVIKGPLDARYGNWGRSGIVLIQTRQAGDFWRGNVSFGSYGTKKGYVSFGSEHYDGKFNQVYSVESFETDGWRQNGAQQRQNAYAKWFYRPAKDVRLGLFTHFYRADWGTGSYIDETQWRENPRGAFPGSMNDGGYKSLTELALHADAKLLGRFPVKAIVWRRASVASRYADWTYEGVGQTDDHADVKVLGGVVSIETDWECAKSQTLRVDGGVDYRHNDTIGRIWNTEARVRQGLTSDNRYIFQNGGVYLKSSYDIAKRLRFSAGIREDLFWGKTSDRIAGTRSDMSTYSVPTYKGGIWGNVFENLSLYGNIGTTYRLPNQAAKYEHPRPKVASLLFWEAGAKATAFDALTLRYAYFQSTERLTRLEQGDYIDDGKAQRAGHEIELKVGPLYSVDFFTAVTVHNGHYVGGENAGNSIPVVPRYIWKAGLEGEAPWGTGGHIQYSDVGKWNTDAANEHSYGGYRSVDLGLYQIVAKDWSLALDVKNLLDTKYSEFVSYWSDSNQYMPSNPRTVFATLRFSKD
jgi:iron complex outermembrane recepter protein